MATRSGAILRGSPATSTTALSRRNGRRRFTAWCMRDGAVDAEATRARRRAIRTERLGGKAPKAEPPGSNGIASVCPMITEGKRFRCLCGTDLGPATQDWKPRAHRRTVLPQAYGPHVTLHADLELREFCCSECGTLLEAEVARRGQDSLATIVLDA